MCNIVSQCHLLQFTAILKHCTIHCCVRHGFPLLLIRLISNTFHTCCLKLVTIFKCCNSIFHSSRNNNISQTFCFHKYSLTIYTVFVRFYKCWKFCYSITFSKSTSSQKFNVLSASDLS